MKKLSEYKGEEAIDLLADLIDPASEIMADEEIAEMLQQRKILAAVKPILKNHKQAVIAILAALHGQTADDYDKKQINLFTIPKLLLAILNDPELINLFSFAEQTEGVTSSGSASENGIE